MKPRQVINSTTTPDGETLELSKEAGHFMIRVGGIPLMSSAAYGSEQALADLAAKALAQRDLHRPLHILVGGLGMGFTLRAALDTFGANAEITVAELLPQIVRYVRGVLAPLTGDVLQDARVKLFEGDVRMAFQSQTWDVILLDVDNGPDALTVASNASLYSDQVMREIVSKIRAGGVLAVWSAYPSDAFLRRLARAGFAACKAHTIRARTQAKKGSKHTIFVAQVKKA